jgi:AcrR family transcriptional regulator
MIDDPRLSERVLPALLSVIERGDFTGPVMRKVANECRMSLNTLYSIVPSKNALLHALAVHIQTKAHAEVVAQTTPGDAPRDISRRALHASFDEFTRLPGLALAALSADPMDSDDPEGRERVVNDQRLTSVPGLASPFARSDDGWQSGRQQVLTFGWLGTTYSYARGILSEEEARRSIDHIVDAAYLLEDRNTG